MEVIKDTVKILTEHSRSLHRDLNLGSLKYETGVLFLQQRCSVSSFLFLIPETDLVFE
jgi:hypothetical protein